MKKMIAFLLILLLMCGILAGCGLAEELELAVCGAYGVPGMMVAELKGGSHELQIIERDSQGRILYSFTADNTITQKEETALVICQHIGNDTGYFYEDICYLFAPYSDEQITQLKQANDWSKELNFDKMTSRPIRVSYDFWIITDVALDYRKIEDSYCEANNIEYEQIQDMFILDVNPKGMPLYQLELERDGEIENYLVIVNLEYECFSLKFDGTLEDFQQLAQFKSDHGWKIADSSITTGNSAP